MERERKRWREREKGGREEGRKREKSICRKGESKVHVFVNMYSTWMT